MDKATPHELRDSLVADLVAQSEKTVGERRGRDAVNLVKPILERMDQKPSAPTPSSTDANEQLQEQARREGISGRVERMQPRRIMTPREADSAATKLLRRRVRWLNSKPEYRTQIETIWTKLKLKMLTPKQAEARFWELVNKSDEQLKRPWWKEDRRLHFS